MTNFEMQDDPLDTIRAVFELLEITTTHRERLYWIAAATRPFPRDTVFVADTASFDDIFNSGAKYITLSDQPYIYPMIVFNTMFHQITTGAPIVKPIQI